MEPESNHNKLKNQIQSLRSGNRTAIITTLKELRADGNVSILPELFNILNDQEDEQLIREVSQFLCDLKDEAAVPILTEAIENPEYSMIVTKLVAACWQNGLAYGKYVETFSNVVLHGEYEAAIEAFTVIEEAIGDLEQNERQQAIIHLKSNLQKINDEKKPLVSELVKVINNY